VSRAGDTGSALSSAWAGTLLQRKFGGETSQKRQTIAVPA